MIEDVLLKLAQESGLSSEPYPNIGTWPLVAQTEQSVGGLRLRLSERDCLSPAHPQAAGSPVEACPRLRSRAE